MTPQDKRYFNMGRIAFWAMLVVLLIFAYPLVQQKVFDPLRAEEQVQELLKNPDADSSLVWKKRELEEDTSAYRDGKKITVEWDWSDYEGRNHHLVVYVPEKAAQEALVQRDNIAYQSLEQIYGDYCKVSLPIVGPLTEAMKLDIKAKGFGYQDALDYVVTSVQSIEYTLISHDGDCSDGMRRFRDSCMIGGCCKNVMPFGCYTPAEFMLKKTGDCDTRALFLYLILKQMGFDVAVLVGDVEGGKHAMLGVSVPTPVVKMQYVVHQGKIYYPWETTGFPPKLGDISGWTVWDNWTVAIN
jgi:hypothetical protein